MKEKELEKNIIAVMNSTTTVELHALSGVSEKAYDACISIRGKYR